MLDGFLKRWKAFWKRVDNMASTDPSDMLIRGQIIAIRHEMKLVNAKHAKQARDRAERDNPLLPLYVQLED